MYASVLLACVTELCLVFVCAVFVFFGGGALIAMFRKTDSAY